MILILDAPGAPSSIDDAPEAMLKGIGGAVLASASSDSPLAAGSARAAAHRAAIDEALPHAEIIFTATHAIDAAMIARARRCMMIVIYGPAARPETPRVDLEAARMAGIYVTSTPDYDPEAWAERTLQWIDELNPELGMPLPLRRRRLGVIGLGSVGRLVAAAARGEGQAAGERFDSPRGKLHALAGRLKLDPVAHDLFADDHIFESIGVPRAPLRELLGMSDIVTVHLPLTPGTRVLLGWHELELLAPGSLLILASPPEVIDAGALAAGLSRRRPAAAVWPTDRESAWQRWPELAAQPEISYDPRLAPGAPGDAPAIRRAAAEVVRRLYAGQRPPHLLIDPPCPRHVLWMAGRGWD